MGFYADIYVIKKTRSKELGEKFINHFVPKRAESADCYEIPMYRGKVEITFQKAKDLMVYLEENPTVEQSIYWRNLDKENLNRHGMIFYTPDSYMIFGISRNSKDMGTAENTKDEDECLQEMKDFFETEEGYITYECPPKDTYLEFIEAVNHYKKYLLQKINKT